MPVICPVCDTNSLWEVGTEEEHCTNSFCPTNTGHE